MEPGLNGLGLGVEGAGGGGVGVEGGGAEPAPHGGEVVADEAEALEEPDGHGEAGGVFAEDVAVEGAALVDGLGVGGELEGLVAEVVGLGKCFSGDDGEVPNGEPGDFGVAAHEGGHDVPGGDGGEEFFIGHKLHEGHRTQDCVGNGEGFDVGFDHALGVPGGHAGDEIADAGGGVDELLDACLVGGRGDVYTLGDFALNAAGDGVLDAEDAVGAVEDGGEGGGVGHVAVVDLGAEGAEGLGFGAARAAGDGADGPAFGE